jgi:membrane protein required for colicin V production
MTNTIISIVIMVTILFFLIDGIRRGLMRQFFEVIGLFAAFVGAYAIGHYLAENFQSSARLSHQAILIVSSVVVFIVIVVVFHMIGLLFQKIVSVTVLGPVDRVGGAIFGALKGILFVSLVCVVVFSFAPAGGFSETLKANPVAARIHPVLPWMYHLFIKHSPAQLDFDRMARDG